MKKILLVSIAVLFISATNAQLANTKWRGIANMAVPTDVLFSFNNDSTAEAFMMPDSISLAVMTFKLNNNVLSLQKVSGQIPCDNNVVGTYNIEIINDKLNIKVIADDCFARSHSLDGTSYDKVK